MSDIFAILFPQGKQFTFTTGMCVNNLRLQQIVTSMLLVQLFIANKSLSEIPTIFVRISVEPPVLCVTN